MYIFSFIVASVPLFFSHLIPGLAQYIAPAGSFERVKVYLFLILLILSIVELITVHSKRFEQYTSKQYTIFSLILLFPLFVHLVSTHGLDPVFFWGSYEKHHGYFFYIGLMFFAGIASLLTKKEFERTILFSLGSVFLVAIFAIIEYLGISLFFPSTGTISWELGRTISTLGNPNYVAGYLLLHVPLVQRIRKPEQYIVLIVLLFAIITTGSMIGIALCVGYFISLFLRKMPHGLWIFTVSIAIGIISLLTLVPHEKLLSLESRGVLMIETMKIASGNIGGMLFGYGPDSLILAYSHGRSEKIASYFPDVLSIDSSHNISIDIAYSYGLIFLILLVFLIIRRWRHIEVMANESLILSILFFSLNVIVLAPLLIMILLMLQNQGVKLGMDRLRGSHGIRIDDRNIL